MREWVCMKDFSCSDIDTGWKPVTREACRDVSMHENSLPDQYGLDENHRYGGLADDRQIREISRMLWEINHEVISLRQMMMDMINRNPAPNVLKKRKLQRKRYFRGY